MSDQIEILASLQTVDREIKEQTGIKNELLAELEAKQKEIEAQKEEIDRLNMAWAEKERQREQSDRVFQDEAKKAMDRRMRMNRIKNVKELQALQREIDQIRQSNGVLEEEIIRLLEEIDGIKAEADAKKQELGAVQQDWQQKKEALRTQIADIDKAVAEAAARRKNIASQVTADLIARYELIFARRGGTAVVEVAEGTCHGCYMNIPPQLWNEIIKNDKIHLCPSCQRILYRRPSEAESNGNLHEGK
ncbi:MAG TPA: C4-type zinc ribbon domain-containing protein [Terriglobales bacterium]|nr:C4-type zinc ribbon domain-containing protein [Terriglobales bacterium]